jgi:response regulator RpfG family c-di-GMP phosphodiesterase
MWLIFFTNSIILYQIKENDQSKTSISKLVSMQENMNGLVKEAVSSNTHEDLKNIQEKFWEYEKEFEQVRESFIKNKDDLIDYMIEDIHQNQFVSKSLISLYKNEKEIEGAFDKILTSKSKEIELINLFEQHYPQESYLRNILENSIMKTKNIEVFKELSNVKYYSKEMLFQHKNREYLTKWLHSIKNLQQNYQHEILDQYFQTAQTLGGYVLKLEFLNKEEISIQNEIDNIIKANKTINSNINHRITELSNGFLSLTSKIMIGILLFAIVFIVYFSKKVNKNVALGINEIEQKVQEGLKEINDLNNEIEDTQKEVIFTMGAIGESRSKETGNHVKRVAKYSRLLAQYYGLSPNEAQLLEQASPMHDIGKVAIPDAVLNKPGRFDASERAIMDTHAKIGYNMLNNSTRPLLKAASIVAYEHHEKWDGTGYPQGKRGENIHIYGRITALADVFDALGSDRCYKKAWEDDRIFALFKEERGKHFDPKLVDIFFKHLDQFLKIREKFKDV